MDTGNSGSSGRSVMRGTEALVGFLHVGNAAVQLHAVDDVKLGEEGHARATRRLNGSSSPVLTATSLSHGKTKNSTPHRIKTPDPIEIKFGRVDYVGEGTRHAKFYANPCLLYTSPSPRDRQKSRMPSSA